MKFNLSKMACVIKKTTHNKAKQGNSIFHLFLYRGKIHRCRKLNLKSDFSFHYTSNITEITNFDSKLDSPLTKPSSKPFVFSNYSFEKAVRH